MGLTELEKEWGSWASRFIKAELKRAGIGYKELAERLNKHGMEEIRDLDNWQTGARNVRNIIFLARLTVLDCDVLTLDDI